MNEKRDNEKRAEANVESVLSIEAKGTKNVFGKALVAAQASAKKGQKPKAPKKKKK